MKKLILILLSFILLPFTTVKALIVNGIKYTIASSNTVSVSTGDPDITYSGNVVIPDSIQYNNKVYYVQSIEQFAFASCSNLTSVTIPNSVTTIGQYAFNCCSGLTRVVLSKSVNYIDFKAFSECNNLTSIYSYSTTPPVLCYSYNYLFNKEYKNVFEYVDKVNCTVFVPQGSKEAYQTANQWADFSTIVELVSTDLKVKTENKWNVCYDNSRKSLQVEGINEVVNVSVYDLYGKVILSKRISENELISLSSLKNGFYMVMLTGKNKSEVIKIVVS